MHVNRVVKAALVAALAVLPALVAVPAQAAPLKFWVNSMPKGSTMLAGDYMTTSEYSYTLIMQTDGNLVEYHPIEGQVGYGHACWATSTHGAGNYAVYQTNNALLVLNEVGRPLWSSGTAGKGGTTVSINQWDGSLYVGTTKMHGECD